MQIAISSPPNIHEFSQLQQDNSHAIVVIKNNGQGLRCLSSGSVSLRDRIILCLAQLPCLKNCQFIVRGLQRINQERQEALQCFIHTLQQNFDQHATHHVVEHFGLLSTTARSQMLKPLQCRDIQTMYAFAANNTQEFRNIRHLFDQVTERVLSLCHGSPMASWTPYHVQATQDFMAKLFQCYEITNLPLALIRSITDRTAQCLMNLTGTTEQPAPSLIAVRQAIAQGCQQQFPPSSALFCSTATTCFSLTPEESLLIDGADLMRSNGFSYSARLSRDVMLLLSQYQHTFEQAPAMKQQLRDGLLMLYIQQAWKNHDPSIPIPIAPEPEFSSLFTDLTDAAKQFELENTLGTPPLTRFETSLVTTAEAVTLEKPSSPSPHNVIMRGSLSSSVSHTITAIVQTSSNAAHTTTATKGMPSNAVHTTTTERAPSVTPIQAPPLFSTATATLGTAITGASIPGGTIAKTPNHTLTTALRYNLLESIKQPHELKKTGNTDSVRKKKLAHRMKLPSQFNALEERIPYIRQRVKNDDSSNEESNGSNEEWTDES